MADISYTELIRINSNINALGNQIQGVSQQVANMASQNSAMYQTLQQLQRDFQRLVVDQQRTAAIQQAATELVTIRQEMTKKFGVYDQVRRSMTGILEATDAALVKTTTISQVSEELIITAPHYWLAPVLVALAGWISNDRDLANRAIKVAMQRDPEHTSLVMALVCRRNDRIDTCYEWLAKYFSTQNSASFDEDSMVYIDAYVNGIFGVDKKNLCNDYITNWINEIKGESSDFEHEQAVTWENYFFRYTEDQSNNYPGLKNYSKDFRYINAYLSRIAATPAITKNFEDINNAEVDKDVLREEVDKRLIRLVNSDDKAERELREKEEYCLAVKALNGDTDKAKQMIETRRQSERNKTLNLVDQMTRTISSNSNATFSEKKTACTFLSGFINNGYSLFMDETKQEFPASIKINYEDWESEEIPKQIDEGKKQQLINSYNNYLTPQFQQEQAFAMNQNNPKPMFIAALVVALLGVVFCFANVALGVVTFIVAGILGIVGLYKKNNLQPSLNAITNKYNDRAQQGANVINKVVNEWQRVNYRVDEFETNKVEKIVA